MDRNLPTDETLSTLQRIVAMLLALADLAERASGRSPAVRSLVLWLLRPGEIVARDYLATLTRTAGKPAPMASPVTDDSAAESIRLATSFRALAAALAAFAIEMFTTWHPVVAAHGSSLAAAGLFRARIHPVAAAERRDSS